MLNNFTVHCDLDLLSLKNVRFCAILPVGLIYKADKLELSIILKFKNVNTFLNARLDFLASKWPLTQVGMR